MDLAIIRLFVWTILIYISLVLFINMKNLLEDNFFSNYIKNPIILPVTKEL